MPSKRAMGKSGEYQLVQKFKGYQARKDPTTEGIDTLISPSRNVKIGTSGRVALVQGYTLDGAASSTIDSGILSNYDFINFKGDVRNMRAGFLTSALNDGKLQYRYVTGTSTVNWVTLKSGLTNVRLSFCNYYDNTALIKKLLWVDGSNNVFEWNGAVTTLLSATAATVTKSGTTTWAQEGFSATGSIVINGVSATYTGGSATTTLTGVSVDYSAYTVGQPIHQEVVTTALSSMTSISSTFAPTVIGCGRRNQVYLGTSNSNLLYISVVNNYKSYAFTSPTRVVGEGALIPLDAAPTSFIAQESQSGTETEDLYISEGLSTWSVIRATLDSTNTKEALEHIRLKVADLQGAKSGRLVGKMKNHIMFIGNDNVANMLGYLSYKFVPTIVDFSYPIIDDMNSYDFTDASIFYYRNYILVAIPANGLIRMYNMTDQTAEQFSGGKALEDITQQPWFWEAPITYPISGFYTVNGELYGHSYTTSESYKLFTGGSFNGQDIDAVAAFGYDDGGDRSQSKGSTETYVEGYIKQNTTLNMTVNKGLGSFLQSQALTIDGNDNDIVSYGGGGNSLGDSPLGVQTLGGATTTVATVTLPAWFNVIPTYLSVPAFYLAQIVFSTKGVDLQWELLTYGSNTEFTNENNNDIKR
jgi:hypothetical protein